MFSALVGHALLNQHQYRVVEPERLRQVVLTQFLGDEYFLALLYVEDEQFFYDLYFTEQASNQRNAMDAFEADGHAMLDEGGFSLSSKDFQLGKFLLIQLASLISVLLGGADVQIICSVLLHRLLHRHFHQDVLLMINHLVLENAVLFYFHLLLLAAILKEWRRDPVQNDWVLDIVPNCW